MVLFLNILFSVLSLIILVMIFLQPSTMQNNIFSLSTNDDVILSKKRVKTKKQKQEYITFALIVLWLIFAFVIGGVTN